MRFIITAQPGPNSPQPDPNAPLDEALFSAYMQFNEEMHKAGVLVAAEGLKPGGDVARVEAKKGRRGVVDGPFTESKELVGGFYVIEVASQEEAIAWALRCPTGLGFDDVLEIRALTGESDIPPNLLELVRKAAPTWSTTFSKKPGMRRLAFFSPVDRRWPIAKPCGPRGSMAMSTLLSGEKLNTCRSPPALAPTASHPSAAIF